MQKKKMNQKKPRVYLAGQITNNRWRNALYKNGVGDGWRNPGETLSADATQREFIYSEYDAGDFIVTGPHSLGCDHSCFHSKKHAALGDHTDTCLDLTEVDHTCYIAHACMDQIRRSDIVFCYIESKECYGTLAEIGYACALGGKLVFVLFKYESLHDELWFIDDMVNMSVGYTRVLYENEFDEINRNWKDEMRNWFGTVLSTYNDDKYFYKH